jgi:hypothetical protein
MVNMFVSAKCARALFNEKVFTLVNIDGAAFFFWLPHSGGSLCRTLCAVQSAILAR